jgi:hypothetical protein
MVLTRQREVALAGFCLLLFGKIIPTFLYETSCEARVGFSLYEIEDGTTFEFSRRQSLRFPGQDWAVDLKPFSEVLKETGLDMMTKSSDFRRRMNETATSNTLPEIANGLIWNSSAHILYRNQAGAEYPSTKEYCSHD